jgi:hypothetical protein
MMANLKPLTEGGATELEQRLLVAGQEQPLPDTERRAIWAGIAAGLPARAAAGLGPSAVAGASTAGLVKGIVAVAVVGASVTAGYQALRPAEPKTGPGQSGFVARPGVAPSAPRAELGEPPALRGASSAEKAPDLHAPAALPAPSSAASQLGEESQAVLRIRQALRSGDPGLALGLLEQARGKFPRGALGQEREALMIEALAQSGARAAAEKRALAFLRAYPKSPYAADVQRYTAH